MTDTAGTTLDTLLGGRVRHSQARDGHRTGIEPALLAAFVPARPGERVLEGGTGAGAALLCLAARVALAGGVGVEINPDQVALARANVAANGWIHLEILQADLETADFAEKFDHAMANPPWHVPGGTLSPDPAKALARHASPHLATIWATALARPLRHRGTLSFITGAGTLAYTLAAFTQAGLGSHTVLPLWPRAGRAAKLVLVQGVKGGRGPSRLLPGLVLHAGGGGYTEAAEAVLRDGKDLSRG